MPGIGLGLSPSLGRRRVISGSSPLPPPPTYDADAQAAFARMAVQPNATQKQRVSTFIADLKAAGLWSMWDCLYLHAQHTEQAGRLNLRGDPALDCTPVNSVPFEAFRGFTPDGASSYLSTNFNPATANDPKFTQNSASLFIRSNTENQAAGSLAGFFDGTKGTTINPRSASGTTVARINSSPLVTVAAPTSVGLFVVNRRDAANLQVYRDGTLQTSQAAASVAPANGALRFGSIANSSFRSCQFSAGGAGSAFVSNAAEQAFHSILQAYLTAIGVSP